MRRNRNRFWIPFATGLVVAALILGFSGTRLGVLVIGKLVEAQQAAQLCPEPGLEGADREELSVLAFIEVVEGSLAAQHGLASTRGAPRYDSIVELQQHHVQQRIHHRQVD